VSENVELIARTLDAIEANDREELERLTEAATHPDCELRGRESDIEIVEEMGTLYEFEGGLFRRGRVYRRHDETLAAAEALHA
jgi:hypothetical protein